MNNKIKVLIVGIGHSHAQGVIEEILSQNDDFEIIGFVENNQELVIRKASQFPFNKIKQLSEKNVLNKEIDIDAIVIETEMSELVSTAIKYLSLEVPMHIDKPTGTNDDFLTFLEKAEEKNIPIQLGYMYRYNPAIIIAKNYINTGKIGEIGYIEALMNTELNISQRKILAQFPGGAMYIYGCHMLDIILNFMGYPKDVYTFIKQSNFDNIIVNDNTFAFLEYEKGMAIASANCVDANGYGRRQIVISGSKGSIEIKPLENPTKITYSARDGKDEYQDKAKPIDVSNYNFNKRYLYMIEDFARLIRKETQNLIFPVDFTYEKNLHRLLMEVLRIKDKGEE